MTSPVASSADVREIRLAVRSLCSRFPGEYWRGLEPIVTRRSSSSVDGEGWLAA